MSGAKGRTWFRTERDWFIDSKLVDLVEKVGPAGVVGWFRLLGRACQTEGIFPHPLSAELRDNNLGINGEMAKEIAAAMVEVGLVQEDEDGLRIAAWSTYQPPLRYMAPAQRDQSNTPITKNHTRVIPENNNHTPVIAQNKSVTSNHESRDDERTNERTNKTNGRTGGNHGLPSIGEILARGGAR